MFTTILFFAELFLLFFLSKTLTASLTLFLYKTTRSKRITIYLLAILFFPGTLLHEIAHAVIAKLLFVSVYHMEFFPKLEGDSVKLGSVGIAKTDPIRRLFIGMAPFFLGTSILLTTLALAEKNHLFGNTYIAIAIFYLVFEIGNTMFSSKKDLEGALEFLLVTTFFAVVFFFLGFRLPSVNPLSFFNNPLLKQVFEKGDMFLLLLLCIDGVLVLVFKNM